MYANPINTSSLLYGLPIARKDFSTIPQSTFYRKSKQAIETRLQEKKDKVINAYRQNMSINKLSKKTGIRWQFCKKTLLEKGLIKTAESTYRKIYDFYIVDLPNRTKTQEIRQAEMDYIKDGNDLLALIRKCEKEKKENSIFKKAYKQYTFQNEVLAKKKSINRLAKLCGFGSARTKKIAERLNFVL